ncbi:MAG: TetR/AcrR family transcriptional regulator [Deltaproteobacteria bacterium]|nr:TetR/AcrR family transcriptional regulator [Deltaproteobacteria bacterium]
MPQFKKEEVKSKIDNTAILLFSKNGYNSTTVSSISKASGIPVGNIYRYYKSKKEILNEVLPENLLENLAQILEDKITNWKTSEGSEELSFLNSKQFINFLVRNRTYLLIHLKMDDGSDGIKSIFVNCLLKILKTTYEEENRYISIIKAIYYKLIELLEEALNNYSSEDDLYNAFDLIHTYHMFGITKIYK